MQKQSGEARHGGWPPLGPPHGNECPVRTGIQHIQTFGEAFGQKSDAAHGQSEHSGESTRSGYPDENQSVDQKWDGADGLEEHPGKACGRVTET